MDLVQSFSVNTACKVNWYRGCDPSLNFESLQFGASGWIQAQILNKIHLFLSRDLDPDPVGSGDVWSAEIHIRYI